MRGLSGGFSKLCRKADIKLEKHGIYGTFYKNWRSKYFMVRDAKQIPIGPLLGDRILVLHGSLTKEDVLNTLIDRLAQVEGMVPHDDLAWGIFHRESLMSTGIGNGIAVPHVRLENIDSPSMALAVCPDGVSDYQSPDNQPVKLVFMVVAGGQQRATHLKILASIGSLFYDGRLKAAFLASPDPENCQEILARAEA